MIPRYVTLPAASVTDPDRRYDANISRILLGEAQREQDYNDNRSMRILQNAEAGRQQAAQGLALHNQILAQGEAIRQAHGQMTPNAALAAIEDRDLDKAELDTMEYNGINPRTRDLRAAYRTLSGAPMQAVGGSAPTPQVRNLDDELNSLRWDQMMRDRMRLLGGAK